MSHHAPKGPRKARHQPSDLIAAQDPERRYSTGLSCTARGKRSGKRCTRPVVPGCTVCRYHGGAAPQVRAAGLERLRQMQEMAIDRLQALALDGQYPSTSYQAVRDILDRTMGRPAETVAVTGAEGGPLEIVIRAPWDDPQK